VKKTVDSLLALVKKPPAGEGTCRQTKLRESPSSRPQLVQSPSRNASARRRRSRDKSGLRPIGYPALQNICDIASRRTQIRRGKRVSVFDIMRPALASARLLRSSSCLDRSQGIIQLSDTTIYFRRGWGSNFISVAGVTNRPQIAL
jgi:hypothetical protein